MNLSIFRKYYLVSIPLLTSSISLAGYSSHPDRSVPSGNSTYIHSTRVYLTGSSEGSSRGGNSYSRTDSEIQSQQGQANQITNTVNGILSGAYNLPTGDYSRYQNQTKQAQENTERLKLEIQELKQSIQSRIQNNGNQKPVQIPELSTLMSEIIHETGYKGPSQSQLHYVSHKPVWKLNGQVIHPPYRAKTTDLWHREKVVGVYKKLSETQPKYRKQEKAKDLGKILVQIADQASVDGYIQEYYYALGLAEECLLVASGESLKGSAGENIVQLFTGRDYGSGERISESAREVSFLKIVQVGRNSSIYVAERVTSDLVFNSPRFTFNRDELKNAIQNAKLAYQKNKLLTKQARTTKSNETTSSSEANSFNTGKTGSWQLNGGRWIRNDSEGSSPESSSSLNKPENTTESPQKLTSQSDSKSTAPLAPSQRDVLSFSTSQEMLKQLTSDYAKLNSRYSALNPKDIRHDAAYDLSKVVSEFGESLLQTAAETLGTDKTTFSTSLIASDDLRKKATDLLDFAVSLTPGLNVGKDLYEAITGYGLITQEELSWTDRTLAIISAGTLGGSKYGIVSIQYVKAIVRLAHQKSGWALKRLLNNKETFKKLFRGADRVVDSARGTSRSIVNLTTQLQRKFKHAGDFGVVGNANKDTLARFSHAVENHIKNPATRVIEGTYKGNPIIHYVDPTTGLNVLKKADGTFISGWRLNAEQLRNVLERGSL